MSLLKRLKEVGDLPTLPEVLLQIQQALASDEADAHRMARIIEHDPSLAARVLRIANSAFYTPAHQRICDISYAVARIGMLNVGSVAMATSLIRTFPNELRALSHRGYWRHCLSVAYLSDTIARKVVAAPAREGQPFFLAGLLHDIGILIYDQYFHDEFSTLIQTAVSQQISFLQSEQVNASLPAHPVLGAAVLETWKMHNDLVSAVRHHHDPAKAAERNRTVVNVVHVAEAILCNSIGSFEGSCTESLARTCALVGFPIEQIGETLADVQTQTARFDSLFGAGHG